MIRNGIGLLLTLVFSAPSWAQTSGLTEKKEVVQSEKKQLGWNKKLILSAGLSFGTSDQVIGQQNGSTNVYSFNLDGQLTRLRERDEWRNTLKISESTSSTPALPKFVKVNDVLDIETLYIYSLESVPWLGPYAKASAQAPIFIGQVVRANEATFEIYRDGALEQTATGDTLRLTDGFRPMTTKESLGGFAKLIAKENIKLEGRAGLGALQVNADGQRVIRDKAETPNIEVEYLRSYSQVGFEAGFLWTGAIDSKTSYSLEGELLMPFSADRRAGDDRDSIRLTNWDLKGRLTSKLYDSIALDYTARALWQPQLAEQLQLQTLLQLTYSYQAL